MEPTTQTSRTRQLMTAMAFLGLALGQAGPSEAQSGALEQLPQPFGCMRDDGDGIDCADGVGLNGPQQMAFSPDGRSAYVPSLFGSTLAIFSRDPITGALTQLPAPDGCLGHAADGITCTDAAGLFGANSVVVSRDGEYVYVGSLSGIAVFARDRATGALTQLPGTDGCLLQSGGGGSGCADIVGPIGPTFVTLSPDGKHLFAAGYNGDAIAIFARDGDTGVLTQLPAPDGCIAEDGDGITCTDAIALDGPDGIAVSRSGKQVYVASFNSDAVAVFARNRTTGVLTQLPAPDGCIAESGDGVSCTDGVGLDGALSIAISKTGRQVYVAAQSGNTIAILTRNARTGMLTQPAAPGGCVRHGGDGSTCTAATNLGGPTSIALSKDGRNAYVTAVSSGAVVIFARDKSTGALTQLAAPNGCVSALGDGITCTGGVAVAAVYAIAMPESGKHVYASSPGNDALAAFARVK